MSELFNELLDSLREVAEMENCSQAIKEIDYVKEHGLNESLLNGVYPKENIMKFKLVESINEAIEEKDTFDERFDKEFDKYVSTPLSIDEFNKVFEEMINDDLIKDESLNEASYGGAYDIADDQYFTREDIDDFSYELVEILGEDFDNVEYISSYLENNEFEITLSWNDWEETVTIPINMRKIRKPSDLQDKYMMKFVDEFANKFAENKQTEEENLYYVISAYDDQLRGIEDDLTTISEDKAKEFANEKYQKGYYVIVKNETTGKDFVVDYDEITEQGFDIAEYLRDEFEYINNLNESLNENSNRYRRVRDSLFGGQNKIKTFAVISADNPLGWKNSDEEEFKRKYIEWTNNKSLYNKNAREKIKNSELLHKIKDTGDEALKYSGALYVPIKGVYGDHEKSYTIFNITLSDAKTIARNYGQESFFFGKTNEDGNAEVSYYETSNACKTYDLIETNDAIVKLPDDLEDFFSKFGLKFKFDMNIFKESFSDITDEKSFEESFDENRTFISRARMRRKSRE